MKNLESLNYGVRYTIYRQEDLNLKTCIKDYLDHIKQEQAKAEARRIEREEKKKLKLAKQKKLKEEEEKALLEELKRKYQN